MSSKKQTQILPEAYSSSHHTSEIKLSVKKFNGFLL